MFARRLFEFFDDEPRLEAATGPGTIQPTGIASEEAFGTPVFSPITIAPTGIASEEAFGTPQIKKPSGDEISGQAVFVDLLSGQAVYVDALAGESRL
jgi:hypothetical protein